MLHAYTKIGTMLSNKTYFKKMFFVILSGFILAVIIISLCVFFMSRNVFLSSQKNSSYSEADNFASWNDSRISTVQSILNTLISDDDVIKYAITGEKMYQLSISDKIRAYNTILNANYTNIGVMDLKRNISISLLGVNKIDLSRITMPSGLDTTHYAHSEDEALYATDGHEYTGATFYKKRVFADDNELLFFYTLYSNSRFDSRRTDRDDDCYAVIYIDKPIYLTNTGYSEKIIEAFSEKAPGFGKYKGYISYKIFSGTDPGFSYFYCTETTSMAGLHLVIILLMMVLLLFSFGIANIVTRRLYSPIDDIVEKFKRFNNEDPGKEDIPYVLSSMDDMFNDIAQLEQKSRNNQNAVINKFFDDLLNGNISKKHISEFIKENNLGLIAQRHTLVSFFIANSADIMEQYGLEAMPYIKKDIVDILRQSISSFYVYHDCYEGFIAFIAGEVTQYELIFEDLADILEADYNITIKIFIGETIPDYSSEMAVYSAMLLQRDDLFMLSSKQSVYKVMKQQANRTSVIEYSIEMERRLIDCILNGRRAVAEQMITTVIDNNIHADATVSTVNQLRENFRITVMRILHYIGKNEEDYYEDSDILNFTTKDRNLDDIKKCLFDMFAPLLEPIAKEDDSKTVRDRERISAFIDEQIKNNIGLDDLAQYLNYSSWYTSKIFKIMFNQNFKSYVNMRRVEIAKELLEQGCKVSEAAAAVGCLHTETFIRIFKKSTGMLPSEYAHRL